MLTVILKRYYRVKAGITYFHTTIILEEEGKPTIEIGYLNQGTGGSLTFENAPVTIGYGKVKDNAHDYFIAFHTHESSDRIIEFAKTWNGTTYTLGWHDCGDHCRAILEFVGADRMTFTNINTTVDLGKKSFVRGKGWEDASILP
jgi:hypothetical protein